jgi:DNA-directed RNA polymerase specialized sigma24 family protein
MSRVYTKQEALGLVSGEIDAWAPSLDMNLADDLRQEMAMAILESKKDSATLSYYRTAMRNRAINYLKREARRHEREGTPLGALLQAHAGVSLAARDN